MGKKDEELQPVYERIGERVAAAKVRYLDETGYRVAGKLQWLHTTSSLTHTFYRAGEKRGAVPEELKGGVVVHDHFRPYCGRMDKVAHAFCNAHILRELEGLIEFDSELWLELMRDLLLEANAACAKREGRARRRSRRKGCGLCRPILGGGRLGLAFHRELPSSRASGKALEAAPGHNLLIRLKKFKTETLRFLTDFDVPFTNNLAEQDLRMMKVRMKIPARSEPGRRQIFARLRSVVSTARKQGFNILQVLSATPETLMQSSRLAGEGSALSASVVERPCHRSRSERP